MRVISTEAEGAIIMYSEEVTREELESIIIKKVEEKVEDICNSKFFDLDGKYDVIKLLSQKLIELHQLCNFPEFHQACPQTWENLKKKMQCVPKEEVINFLSIYEKIKYLLIQSQEFALMQDEQADKQIDAAIRIFTTEIGPDYSWPSRITERLDNALEILRHRKFSLKFIKNYENLGINQQNDNNIEEYIKSNIVFIEKYPHEPKQHGAVIVQYAICEFYHARLNYKTELGTSAAYFLLTKFKNQALIKAFFEGIPVQYWSYFEDEIIHAAIKQKNYQHFYFFFQKGPVEDNVRYGWVIQKWIAYDDLSVKEVRDYLDNLLAYMIAEMKNYYPDNLNFMSEAIDVCTIIWEIGEHLRLHRVQKNAIKNNLTILSEEQYAYNDEPSLNYQALSQIVMDIIAQEQFDLLKKTPPHFLKFLVKDFPISTIKKLIEIGPPEWYLIFVFLLNPSISGSEIKMALDIALAKGDANKIEEIIDYIDQNMEAKNKNRPANFYINYENQVMFNRQASWAQRSYYTIQWTVFNYYPELLTEILALAEQQRRYTLIRYIQSNYYFFLSPTESVFSALFSRLNYLLIQKKISILYGFPEEIHNLLNDYINLAIQQKKEQHTKILRNMTPLLLNNLDVNSAKPFLHTAVQCGNHDVVQLLLEHEIAEIRLQGNAAKPRKKLPMYNSKVDKLDASLKTCFNIALETADATIILQLLRHADVIMDFNIQHNFEYYNNNAGPCKPSLSFKERMVLWLPQTGSGVHCNPLLAENIITSAELNAFREIWHTRHVTNSAVLKYILEAKTYMYFTPLFIKKYFSYEVFSKLKPIARALNDDESLIQAYLEGLYHYLDNIICMYHQAKQEGDMFRVKRLESFQGNIPKDILAAVPSILPTIRDSELFLAYIGLLYRAISLGFRGMLYILTDMKVQDEFVDYLNRSLESAFPSFGMPMQNIIAHVKDSYMRCKNNILVATQLLSNLRAYTYLEQILHESSVFQDKFTGSSYITPLMHIIPLIAYSDWDWTNRNDISCLMKLINSLHSRYFQRPLLEEVLWHQFKDEEEEIILVNLLDISFEEREKLLSIGEINRVINKIHMLIFLIQQEWDTEFIDRQTGDSIMHKAFAIADVAYRQQSLASANGNEAASSIELIEKIKSFIALTGILVNNLLDAGHTLTQTNKLKKYPLEQIEQADLIKMVIAHSSYQAIAWEHTRLLIFRNYNNINLITELLNSFRYKKLNLFNTDSQKNGILHLIFMDYQDSYPPDIIQRLLDLYVYLGENDSKQKPSDLARKNKLPAPVLKSVKEAENGCRQPAVQQYLLKSIYKGETKYVEGLVESGVPFLSARDEDNNNALHCAIIAGVPGIIALLRKAGADALIYEPNNENIRPLRLAAAPGPHQNWSCVKAMLSERKLSQHEKYIYSEILHWAVEALEHEMIKFLIEELGVNVNYLQDETLLHFVIKHEVKIDIRGGDYKEREAAKSEIEVKRLEIIEILLNHSNKIDPRKEDADGRNAFELAIIKGRDDIQQKFLERGLGHKREQPNCKPTIDGLKGHETLSYMSHCSGPELDAFEEDYGYDEYADEREFNREIRLAAAAESTMQDVTNNRDVNEEVEVVEISSQPVKIDKGKRKYQSKFESELLERERGELVIRDQEVTQSSFSEGSTSTSIPAGQYKPVITHLTTHSIFAFGEVNTVGGATMSEQPQKNNQTIQEEGNTHTFSKKIRSAIGFYVDNKRGINRVKSANFDISQKDEKETTNSLYEPEL